MGAHYTPEDDATIERLWRRRKTDDVIGEILRRPAESIAGRRKRLRLVDEPCVAPCEINWDAVDWSKSNAALAVELGVPNPTVRGARRRRGKVVIRGEQRAWTTEEINSLGKDYDHIVAAKIGRSLPSVRSKRLKLGIHAHGE